MPEFLTLDVAAHTRAWPRCFLTKQSSLELKTRLEQLLRYLPLAGALSRSSVRTYMWPTAHLRIC
jgi:hypothetical protein